MIPIPNAINLVRRAFYAALSPLVAPFQGVPACYWNKPENGVADALLDPDPANGLPACLSFHSADGGGKDTSTLEQGRWEGAMAVKSWASTPDGCETQLAGVFTALDALIAPDGFLIDAAFLQPLTPPTLDGIAQAGQVYHVTLRRLPPSTP